MMGMSIFPVAHVRANASFLPCRKQSPGCWSDVRARHHTDKVEGGGEPRVGAEQPLAGSKEVKWFWAMPAAECKLCFGKHLLEVASEGKKKIPCVFLHPYLWLPSPHCPINEERMVLARLFFHLCTNQFIDSCPFHPSNDNSTGLCRFHAINVSAINFPSCWALEKIEIPTFCSKFLL